MKVEFSLVIPTFNEARNIEPLCLRLVEVLAKADVSHEIIIVDDDSPDQTWKLAQELSNKYKAIKVIRRMSERGLGSAVAAGWKKAEGDILGVIDGDLQHPPELLRSMLKIIRQDPSADIVIASRYTRGGGVSKWSLSRRAVSFTGTAISAFFLRGILKKVKDPMSGYFILRRGVIQGKTLKPMGYKILLEVLAKGKYQNAVEIPYLFHERAVGGSKAGIRQYLTSFFYILSLSAQTRQLPKALKKIGIILIACLAVFLAFKLLGKR